MLTIIALDREQGPNGGKPREIKREKVSEMMTQEQRGKSHECLVFPVLAESNKGQHCHHILTLFPTLNVEFNSIR